MSLNKKGTKLLISGLLCASIIGTGVFASLSTMKSNASSPINTSNLASTLSTNPIYNQAQELFSQRNTAFSKGDMEQCNKIDQQLTALGYREATPEETGKFFDNSDDGSTGCKAMQSDRNIKTVVSTYTHKVDNKAYTIKEYVHVPKNCNSTLYTSNSVSIENKSSVKAGSTSFLKSVTLSGASFASEEVGLALNIYDAIKSTVKGASKKTVVKNIKANYIYNIAETVQHLEIKGKESAVFNMVDYTVQTSIPKLTVKGSTASTSIKTKQYNKKIRPWDYGNASKAVYAYNHKTKHVNTCIMDIKITGVNKKKIINHKTFCSYYWGTGDTVK